MSSSDGLGAAAYPQLAVDVAGVFLHRVQRDRQVGGDLWVGVTFADEAHDLQLARGEAVN